MKQIDLNRVLHDDAESWFQYNSIYRSENIIGDHNLSVDGTGKNVSVGMNVGRQLACYIGNKFTCSQKLITCDIGTGQGNFVNALIENDIDAYGLEGSSELVSLCKNNHRIGIMDLSAHQEDLYKAFHLTTSFEVIEHIHRSKEDIFFDNLAHMSDWHFCSIHMDGWPGMAEEHCNIKHECCWMEYFYKHNVGVEILDHARQATIATRAKDFLGSKAVTYPSDTSGEIRQNIKFGQWNEWESSMFCILDLRNFQ